MSIHVELLQNILIIVWTSTFSKNTQGAVSLSYKAPYRKIVRKTEVLRFVLVWSLSYLTGVSVALFQDAYKIVKRSHHVINQFRGLEALWDHKTWDPFY